MVVHVHLDWLDQTFSVGKLDIEDNDGNEVYSFSYDEEWLDSTLNFMIDPELKLSNTVYKSDQLWQGFMDILPQKWGRLVHDRTMNYFDIPRSYHMLLVSDTLRQGAMRLTFDGHNYIAKSSEIPTVAQLAELESAAIKLSQGDISDKEFELLRVSGGAMGGSTPKAVVAEDDKLYIAKFCTPGDHLEHGALWENIALNIAKECGINAANSKLATDDTINPVLLVERFDRYENKRIPFISAMTLALGCGYTGTSYLEFPEIINIFSAAPKEDMLEIWKRMVFNVVIGNTDDQMYNHAFLRTTQGWRLAPAYDLVPSPENTGSRAHILSFNREGDTVPTLDMCIESGKDAFGLSEEIMNLALHEMVTGIFKWEKISSSSGASVTEIKKMERAFLHNITVHLSKFV